MSLNQFVSAVTPNVHEGEKRRWGGPGLLLYSSSLTRDKEEAPHYKDLVRQVTATPNKHFIGVLAPGCGATHDDIFLLEHLGQVYLTLGQISLLGLASCRGSEPDGPARLWGRLGDRGFGASRALLLLDQTLCIA